MGPIGRSVSSALLLLAMTGAAWAGSQKASSHVVQDGQTLAKIAKRYQITLDELCEANSLKRSATLKPGVRLSIPGPEQPAETQASKTARRDAPSRSMATVGRTDATVSKVTLSRQASYSQYLAPPAKRGWVHLMGHHGEFKGQLVARSGKLQTKSVLAISKILAWPRTDFVMDRRLLMLLAKVSDAFGGRVLRAVSGYRTTSYSSESKHPLGRACDFHVLGVPNAALRDFLRTFDDVGVGFYPNSTFVHLDARDYDAYWVDYAGPGEPPRYSANGTARRSDRGSTVIRSSADPLELIEGSSDEVHELPPNSTLRDAIGSDAIPPASGTQRKVLDESIRGNTVTTPSDSGPSEPEIERPNPVTESKQAAPD